MTEPLSSKDGWAPRAGEMHPVDQAFHDLAIKERNYERVKCDRLEAEAARLRHGLELIVRESEQFPGEDGIGAGTMARNLLKGAGC